MIADRGYDSDHIRKTMEVRDVLQGIPVRKTRKLRVAVDARRAVLQQAEKRRVARRYDKNADSFLGFIDITNRF
ncbi:hypothetical protein SAMN04487971_12913 [Paracoccus chinensis]|uniref:Transposase DDE domain-containing protein n=1 Tax=Paracoccus chinensis TaxID=525640 RepID=A0A1G9NDH2_9RHOB|nr:hypothetical protein SAMN04487971_12913 [Paracoccus chinensis]